MNPHCDPIMNVLVSSCFQMRKIPGGQGITLKPKVLIFNVHVFLESEKPQWAKVTITKNVTEDIVLSLMLHKLGRDYIIKT